MAELLELTPASLERAGLGALFRPCDLEPLGINEPRLRTLVRRGLVERVARGLYRLVAAETSEHFTIAAVCARHPSAILCLLTALQIHGIGTRLSPDIWLGVPHGQRPPRSELARVRVVRFSGVLQSVGVERVRIDGVPTQITDPARTIIDCFRLTRLIDRETAVEAAREGIHAGAVTTNGLLRMAKACEAPRRVRQDLEVLSA